MPPPASILVVDDEPRWLESLGHVLTSAGYDVRPVSGGESALDSVADRLPDVILLDIRMPGIGGFDVLRKLKEQEETRGIPVLLLSAFAEVEERIEGLRLGAVDSITKPFHAGELLARVRMQLEMSHLRALHGSQTAALESANAELRRVIDSHKRTGEELRKTGERLNFALQTMCAGAWELDLADHTAHRTLMHDRIFGYETLLPDWTYEKFLEHVLPEDRPEVDRCFREATSTHSDWGFECRIRRADGEVRWIWAKGAHELNPEGKPVRMAGIVQDITDRRTVETALRESEANLSITLQSIGDAVMVTDAGGRITRMNPAAERLTGWPFAEAEGREMSEVFRIVNAHTRRPVDSPVQTVIARGATVGLANHTVLLSRDGREYQIADSAAPIRNPAGEILGVILVFSDVTERYEASEALRHSEEDYRLLFEGMLEGFALHEILCDEAGKPVDYRFLSINPAFEKMTGMSAGKVLGKTVREIMPGIEASWIERYGRVALTGEPVHFKEHSSALGRDFHVTAYRPQPGRFAVVFEDITGIQEAEARISRLNQLYVALSQCNQSIVHSKSTDELLPKICRDVVEFGGLKMAWIGLVDEATGAVRPAASYGEGTDYLKDVKATTDARDATGRGPTGTSIRENRPVWCQDFQNDPMTAPWHEPGTRYGWKSAAALPLHLGGQAIGAFVMYGDRPNAFEEDVRHLLVEMVNEIDFAMESFSREEDRRRGEEALREREETMRLIVKHDPNALAIFDNGMRYLAVSDRFIKEYNVQPDIIGKHHYEVFPEIPQVWRDVHQRCLAGAVESKDDDRFERPDGSVTYNRWECRPWYRAGGEIGGIIMYTEVTTERKMAEEALKELNSYLESATVRAEELAVKAESAARAKSEFLALMSHELRTPLNGVLGFAELLSGTSLDEEQQEYARTILDSGNHLLDVVNDILDFSSIEKGRMQIESAPLVIAALLESTCRAIRKAAADKGLEFRCVMAGDVPAEITGDSRRIRQILINLLGNAVKFTQQGSVELVVSPASVDGSPAVDFSVEDSGPGITEETLGRLFKPFTQADTTVSRQFEGTGLGLAISRRLAEAMGGTLGVESTPGKGSKFTFRLPLDAQPPPLSEEEMSENPPAGASGGRPHASGVTAPPEGSLILVVEDDAANRMLAGKMIEHLGCRVEFAANGREAIDAFLQKKYSAILMDMQMPVMDGMEATRKIRELESGDRTPIIALTANVMPGDREQCLEGGMDEFLTKPFKLGDLERMLARFLPS